MTTKERDSNLVWEDVDEASMPDDGVVIKKEGKFYMAKKKEEEKQNIKHFALKKIAPLTENQRRAFEEYESGNHLVLHGYAGTGKTYISIHLALKEILRGSPIYDKIIIIRSVVPSREIGYLPGNYSEKIRIYEDPYKEICDDLFDRYDGYDILKTKKLIEFTTTSYLRGMTFENAIVIVDEINNMTFQELDTVMTRMGNNSKVIFCGDYRQSDLEKKTDRDGLLKFLQILNKVPKVKHIEFQQDDIVRSGIVKSYIITKTELGF